MKLILTTIVAAFLLSGCGSNPFKPPFPDLPEDLMKAPTVLKTINTDEQNAKLKLDDTTPSSVVLSTLSKVIVDNYKTCNVYREQIIGLQDWLTQQKVLSK